MRCDMGRCGARVAVDLVLRPETAGLAASGARPAGARGAPEETPQAAPEGTQDSSQRKLDPTSTHSAELVT